MWPEVRQQLEVTWGFEPLLLDHLADASRLQATYFGCVRLGFLDAADTGWIAPLQVSSEKLIPFGGAEQRTWPAGPVDAGVVILVESAWEALALQSVIV